MKRCNSGFKQLVFVLAIIPIAFAPNAFAQLSGTKTIGGTTPDYPTIKAAIQDLNAQGVTAPGVTFLVRTGTYAEDSLSFRTSTASAGAPVTLKPDAGATVVINVTPPSTAYNFAIKIDSTQYVTVDGSNNGTTSRDLTINALGANGQKGVWISGQSYYATIKNCIVRTGGVTSAFRAIDVLYTTAVGGNPNNCTIQNNLIKNAYYGIRSEGNTATDLVHDLTIRNNRIDSIAFYGMYIFYTFNAAIYDNEVSMAGGTSTVYALYLASTTYNLRVYNNKVHDLTTTSTSAGIYGVAIFGTATLSQHAIFNNFFWGFNPPTAGTNTMYGIYHSTANTSIPDTIAFNSVNLQGTTTGNKTTYAYYRASATGPAYLYNNILQNTRVDGTTGTAYAVYKTTAPTVVTSNNNNLYVGTPDAQHQTGRIATTNYASLADWRAANSSDGASVAENSPFVGATDLHIQTGVPTQLESGGVPVPAIATDIDGGARNATTPDIGADEFAGIASDLTAPQIAYTPLNHTTSTTARTLNATITDVSGVPTAGIGLPMIYWRANSGAYTGVTGAFVSGNQYSFTFGGGVATGDTIWYYIVAQDNASTPNVGAQPSAGAGGFTANPPAAATPPTTPSRYFIVQQPLIAGDYTIGLTLFEKAIGKDLTMQTFTRRVWRDVPVGPEINPKATKTDQFTGRLTPYENTESRQVEESYSVLMENGRPYDGETRVWLTDNQKRELGLSSQVLAVYPTITAAVNDFNLRGVSGSIRFLLNDASYPTETFPIVVSTTSDSVPTASKRVTFKPNTGVTATVAGAAASGQIFKVLNSYVIFDGSNTAGGTTRDLTLQNTSATTPQVVVFGSTGTTPIVGDTLKNCVVINGAITSTAVIVSDGAAPGTAGYFSNIGIINNKIHKAYMGVYSIATVAPLNGNGLMIRGNDLTPSAADSIRYVGLYVQGVDGGTISSNHIGGFGVVTGEIDRGIWLATGTSNTLIEKNTIHDLVYTGTSGYGGKGIAVSSGLAAANNTIQNNMIYNIAGDGDNYATLGAIYAPTGIYVFGAGQGGVNIYYNSIYLYGNTLNYIANVYAFGIALDDGSAASVKNNLVVNNLGLRGTTGVGPVGIAAEISNAQFTAIDYNDYYTNASAPAVNNIGKIAATDYPTLAAWVPASGGETNSISVNANFLSPTNLHIDSTQATPLNGGATPIVGITTDYDGQARNSSTPDIGADEFGTPSGPGLNGSYTVGAAGNYTTLSAAIAALTTEGVSGPVTFLFTDASYSDTAQIITPYAGQGTTNMVTFKPAPSITPRIVIGGGSATNASFAVRMDSVRGIVWDGSNSGGSDRSMTIESDTNTTTARTPFFIRKGSKNVTLKNMIIKGNRHSAGGIPSVVVIDNTGFGTSGGQNDMTITNCQLMRGNNGIFVNAASGAVRDSNHTFTRNLIGGAASASVFDHLAAAGITMTGNHNVLVDSNDVNGIKVAGTPVGIRINGANTGVRVTKNRIHNLVTLSGAFRPLCFLVGNIIATGPAVRTRAMIANNMIYDIHNFGAGVSGRGVDGLIYNPTGGTNSPNGNGSTIDWYYNSWNIDMAAGEGGGLTGFLFDGNFAGSNPTAGHSDSIRFYNNVASIKRADSVSARMFLLLQEVTPGNFALQSNNNVYYYYTGPFAQIQSPYPGGTTAVFPATVTEFRDSTRLDSASVFGNPQFVSSTDAHISTSAPTPVESAGRPIAGITTDFDGQTRNATTPDIGADEGTFIGTGAVHDIGVSSVAAAAAFDSPSSVGPINVASANQFSRELAAQYDSKIGKAGKQVAGDVQNSKVKNVATASEQTRNAVASNVGTAQRVDVVANEKEQIAYDVLSAGYLAAAAQPAFANRAPAAPAASSAKITEIASFASEAPANFRALVRNFGAFVESTYQVGWTIDGAAQTAVNQPRPLQVGAIDTVLLTWASPTVGAHVLRAFTMLASDLNRANDTASYNFTVTPSDIVFSEGFNDTIPPYPAGWHVKNMDGGGTTTYFQGNPAVFPAFEGSGYIGANYNAANVRYIDEWLVTPNTGGLLANPNAVVDSLIFWQRSPNGSTWPDSIQIRVSTTDTAVASFTTVLAYFQTDTIGWRRKAYALPNAANRYIAFRYLIFDGGLTGNNSNYFGIDAVQIKRTSGPTLGWTVRVSGTTAFLQSVKQVNANVIWAAGNGAVVRRSTDGGTTWTDGNPNPGVITGDIYSIEALDANTAFVTTSPTATFIYRTTNGGTLWTQVFTQVSGFINAIRMLNSAVGIATGDPVGGTFTIVGTTDGGATWTRVPPANEPVPVGSETGINNSLSTVGTTHIWFGSSVGPVWRSTNSGTSWTRVATTFTTNNLEVHFNNTLNGVTGSTAAASRSTDGGATWVATTVPATGNLNGLSGAGYEFFASKGTNVYRSTDRGATWALSFTGTIGTLSHLDFFATGATVGASFYGTAVSQTGGIATAFIDFVTGVREPTSELPTVFSLAQNYPNPFNPSTTIRYALPEAARVNLSIYNLLGQRVAELTNEVESAGFYNVVWNGSNQNGSQVATGVYFYRIEATPVNGGAPFISLKKALLLK